MLYGKEVTLSYGLVQDQEAAFGGRVASQCGVLHSRRQDEPCGRSGVHPGRKKADTRCLEVASLLALL